MQSSISKRAANAKFRAELLWIFSNSFLYIWKNRISYGMMDKCNNLVILNNEENHERKGK